MTNPKRLQKKFLANLRNLTTMMQWIVARIEEVGFSPSDSKKIQLAMEEALVNVIRYAYPKVEGGLTLSCSSFPHEKVIFEILDQGQAFNPLEAEVSDQSDIEMADREEGGLGIILIKNNMDEVSYERREDSNVLILTKNCS